MSAGLLCGVRLRACAATVAAPAASPFASIDQPRAIAVVSGAAEGACCAAATEAVASARASSEARKDMFCRRIEGCPGAAAAAPGQRKEVSRRRVSARLPAAVRTHAAAQALEGVGG